MTTAAITVSNSTSPLSDRRFRRGCSRLFGTSRRYSRPPISSVAMESRRDVLVSPLPPVIEELWERRGQLTPDDTEARAAIVAAVDALDAGEARVAWPDPATGEIVVDERAKRAILLAFRVLPMRESQAGEFHARDRIPLKTRLDGGVGIGGVLEPPNAVPVVVEDDAFVGSRSMIVDGARVRRGAKLGAGTMLTATTHVIDSATGEELPRGEVPPWSVCVSGTRSRSFPGGDFGLPCVLVLARLAEGSEHDKLALNDILRDHGVNG